MDEKIYKTDNMAIAAYLDIHGLEFLGIEIGKGRTKKQIVIFKFRDEKGVAIDLERAFRNSPEKKYREATLFFRNEVYKVTDGKIGANSICK